MAMIGLMLMNVVFAQEGSTLVRSSKLINTTLDSIQVQFDSSDFSSGLTLEVGGSFDLKFDVFVPWSEAEPSVSFDVAVVSQASAAEIITPSKFEVTEKGAIQPKSIQVVIPDTVGSVNGDFVFRVKRSGQLDTHFESPLFKLIYTSEGVSWPLLVVILIFPPLLIGVAIFGGWKMMKNHKKIEQEQELDGQDDYEHQLDDDDVDIHFNDDDDHHRHTNLSERKKSQAPRDTANAFVLEDEDDEPVRGSLQMEDDDEIEEKRGNFYYTKNV